MKFKPPPAFPLLPSPHRMEGAAEIVPMQNRKEIYKKLLRTAPSRIISSCPNWEEHQCPKLSRRRSESLNCLHVCAQAHHHPMRLHPSSSSSPYLVPSSTFILISSFSFICPVFFLTTGSPSIAGRSLA